MTPHLLIHGDARRLPLADQSVHCVVTSPPYWGLRDYGTATWQGGDAGCDHVESGTDRGDRAELPKPPAGWAKRACGSPHRAACRKCGARRIDAQLGLEATPEEFVASMVTVFREVRRVLRDDGTCWVNLGDTYAGSKAGNTNGGSSSGLKNDGRPEASRQRRNSFLASDMGRMSFRKSQPPGLKPKDLVGIPWRVAFALQADGWYLRSDIIWAKPNPMPESVTDRPTKSHEYLFLLTKRERYYYDADAIREAHVEAWRGKGDPAKRAGSSEATRVSFGLGGSTRVRTGTFGNDPAGTERVYNLAGRNARSVWSIPSEAYPGAHFATFPRKLVEPCIKAGTSEKGCCPKCSAPWERVIERESFGKAFSATKFDESHQAGPLARSRNAYRANGMEGPPSPKMLGWRPTCTHDSPPVPSTVFDPFAGSGTTGVVALALGRRFVGVDLSSDYLAMAARRINRPHAPMVRIRDEEPLPLFSRFDA